MKRTTRRQFLGRLASTMPWLAAAPVPAPSAEPGQPVAVTTLTAGDLRAVLRDNSQSPKVLSGVDALFHLRHAPDVDAFDPDSPGASAGLNFEHIICGHRHPANAFTPRHGKYTLYRLPDGQSALLRRERADDPWAVSNTLQYTLTPPHYLDVEFRCVVHDQATFGRRGYAIFFFANYMNDVEDVALHFRGVEGEGQPEKWVRADAPKGSPNWHEGGTYRSLPAADLGYDADHGFQLNSWSYDYPRFTQPFYYGRAGKGMVFQLMFDKLHTAVDEVRFSLFKFKLKRFPRPAWDFQYVLRKIEAGKEYGFRARLVWTRFISPEDCLREYQSWAKAVSAG